MYAIGIFVIRKKKERKFGAAKGFFQVSPDFDEPLSDFEEYTK
ncbi:MAG: DUF2281 domain-containing protein [Bacteroidetes bacterium]|nr:DUF2281 domain-containing protein [Bacteroidota bacterium]